MKIYHGFKDKRLQAKLRCIAIGIFDGVHRGHQMILSQALKGAKRSQAESLVITFEPHPNKVLRPTRSVPILMSLPHRLRSFEKMGITEALVIHFNKKFSKISHRFFLQ
jgi:riboflavin kinase/FMN adenylyltransferase